MRSCGIQNLPRSAAAIRAEAPRRDEQRYVIVLPGIGDAKADDNLIEEKRPGQIEAEPPEIVVQEKDQLVFAGASSAPPAAAGRSARRHSSSSPATASERPRARAARY